MADVFDDFCSVSIASTFWTGGLFMDMARAM